MLLLKRRLVIRWQEYKFFTFLNPMSFAYSLKHCLQMFRPYFRISPCLLEQARLKNKTRVLTKLFCNYKNLIIPTFYTYHERDPCPYLRGWEYQIFAWPIVKYLGFSQYNDKRNTSKMANAQIKKTDIYCFKCLFVTGKGMSANTATSCMGKIFSWFNWCFRLHSK